MQQTNTGASEFDGASVDAPASPALLGRLDLRIEIGFMEVIYEGTAEQLTAEGLIPAQFEWPGGRDKSQWDSGHQEFELWKQRPPACKGVKPSQMDSDWWFLRVRPVSRPCGDKIWRMRKQAEIEALNWELSAKGAAARRELANRVADATWDKSFQAFKQRVPGLAAPRRGRRKKSAVGELE